MEVNDAERGIEVATPNYRLLLHRTGGFAVREVEIVGQGRLDRFDRPGEGPHPTCSSAGLLIRPEEWADVKYNARPLLTAERPDADSGKPWQLHWVTWMFPEPRNAAAKKYMRTNSESTARKLLELFAQ